MGSITILLLLVAVGTTMAYVSPDDQRVVSTDPRDFSPGSRTTRAKPQPLSPQEARRKRVPVSQRRSRDVGASSGGSFASSGSFSGAGGAGVYQGVSTGNMPQGYGYTGSGVSGGNSFPGPFPFNNPNMAPMPFDFPSLFQYLQQMQQAFQQNAINQGFGPMILTPPVVSSAVSPMVSGSSHTSSSSIDNGPISTSSSWPSHVVLENGSRVPIATAYATYAALLPNVPRDGQPYSNNALGGPDNGANFMGGFNQGAGYADGASAVASLGPQGGYGSANLVPDLGSRFGSDSGNVPPPTGGNFGVFSSSSSGTSDVNGHRTSFKTATSGINDNGKITTFTVRDPPRN